MTTQDVVIVGGCGRVGFPLGLALADRHQTVTLFDLNAVAVDRINGGELPFDEPGASAILPKVAGTTLFASTDPRSVGNARCVVVVVGTPVDEHLNPLPAVVPTVIADVLPHMADGQLLVLRSTLYPGVTALVERLIERSGKAIDVAYCPERIAEGKAMTELWELPQLVATRSDRVYDRAAKLFSNLTSEIVRLSPEEAELAKLFTNTWRYIKFAAANQMYMVANDSGLDFEIIRGAMGYQYPRASDLPSAGLAGGPCLLKDTMQVSAFHENRFSLGLDAMMINESLPQYLVRRMELRWDLSTMTVGLLGMAFKSDSDDTRSSLSYKLKRLLSVRADRLLTTDPHVTGDPDLHPLDEVLAEADLLVVGAPHRAYAGLGLSQPVVDVWDLFGEGVKV